MQDVSVSHDEILHPAPPNPLAMRDNPFNPLLLLISDPKGDRDTLPDATPKRDGKQDKTKVILPDEPS